jgi:hypothetical protein
MHLKVYNIFILSILLFSIFARAQSTSFSIPSPNQNLQFNDRSISKIIELYNLKKYDEVVRLFDLNKKSTEKNPLLFYYKGLSLARLKKYEDAISAFENYVQRVDLSSAARGFYFIGLMEFYKGSYERSMTSLDIAFDLSKDPNLDRLIDNLTDKAIRYRNYFKTRKKINLAYMLGYGYDSNVIDISQSLSETNLSGHVFNYGFMASYRLIDKIDFVVEPNMTIVDHYTFSNSFKSEAKLQQADILQAIFSLPFLFHSVGGIESNTRFEISLNAFTSYVPVRSTSRDQYLSSQYIKAGVSKVINSNFNSSFLITYSSDQNVTVIDDALNASGTRWDAKLILNQFLTKRKDVGLGYQLSHSHKNAVGSDAKYAKTGLALEYWAPSYFETSSLISFTSERLRYWERADGRIDNLYSLDLYFSKKFEENLTEWTFLLGGALNESNIDVNAYNDLKFGISYLKQFSF